MPRRPLLVTIAAWILIISGCSALFGSFALLHNPDYQTFLHHLPVSPSTHQIITYAVLGLGVLTGIFLIEGKNWARYFFLALGAFDFLYGTLVLPDPSSLLYGEIYYLITSVVLFLPKSGRYFNRHHRPMWR